ncbi:HEAT repeat domain-containing protein [Planctomycetota bacterium]
MTNDSELEKLLHKYPYFSLPDNKLRAKGKSLWRQATAEADNLPGTSVQNGVDMSPATERKTRLLSTFLIPLAAGLLVIGGLYYWHHRPQGKTLVQPGISECDFATKPMFLFVESREIDSNHFAFLQEMQCFEILKKAKGDYIQNYTILDILDDGIEVTSQDGSNEYLSREYLQAKLDTALVGELGQLKRHAKDNILSDAGLERIGQWATYGNETAIQMLETLSTRPAHAHHARASELLFGGKQALIIKKLMRALEADNYSYRLNAVNGLSGIDSPHSRTALRKIAFGKKANLSIAAVRGLGRLKDKGSLQQLSALIKDPEAESSLRKVAENVYQEIVGTSSQEE